MTCQLEESPAHPPTELGWVTVTWHGITVQLDTRNLSFSCAQRVGQYLTILTYRLSMKQLDRKNQTSLPENFVKFHVVALSPPSWNTTYHGHRRGPSTLYRLRHLIHQTWVQLRAVRLAAQALPGVLLTCWEARPQLSLAGQEIAISSELRKDRENRLNRISPL